MIMMRSRRDRAELETRLENLPDGFVDSGGAVVGQWGLRQRPLVLSYLLVVFLFVIYSCRLHIS